jgi:hypothetical protein
VGVVGVVGEKVGGRVERGGVVAIGGFVRFNGDGAAPPVSRTSAHGALAVQLAKHLGAGTVIAVGRGAARLAGLADRGAERTVSLDGPAAAVAASAGVRRRARGNPYQPFRGMPRKPRGPDGWGYPRRW